MPPPLSAAARMGLSLRPMTGDDVPFVAALVASIKAEELSLAALPEAQLAPLLAQQHASQDRQFRSNFPDAEWLIVEQGGAPVGRLYLAEQDGAVHVIDVSIAAAARGRGLGGALLEDVMAAAATEGKGVSLEVARTNRAARLYQRLGFVPTRDLGVYVTMQWTP